MVESLSTPYACAPRRLVTAPGAAAGREACTPGARVAVVGAGLAGLAAAEQLQRPGVATEVFEKARGAGGRTATRRVDGYAFDHGAPFFSVHDPRFHRWLQASGAERATTGWQGHVIALGRGPGPTLLPRAQRLVGAPGMSSFARALAERLTVRYRTPVAAVTRRVDGWTVTAAEACHHGFDAVLLANPAEQARALLETAHSPLARRVAGVVSAPCWAVMVAFPAPVPVPFDGLRCGEGPLALAVRHRRKPGRDDAECWTLLGQEAWSREHLEADRALVADTLLAALAHSLGRDPGPPCFTRAHRWRYARPLNPLGVECLWDAEGGLGACGDWCPGGGVEGAVLSGVALGRRVAAALGAAPCPLPGEVF